MNDHVNLRKNLVKNSSWAEKFSGYAVLGEKIKTRIL
jgi:hypothetical protein